MKLQELRVLLDEEYKGDNWEMPVVIETSKQLLPNAQYDFEVDVEDGRIILRPVR